MRSGLTSLVAAFVAAALFPAAAAAEMQARGSVEQVYATGLPAGAEVNLLGPDDRVMRTRTVNHLGGTLFRKVPPGDGYRVRAGGETSGPLSVMPNRSAPPSTDVYEQSIPSDGYGYLTTRDGIKLAYSVHPPQDVVNALGYDLPNANPNGPWPTLIEYSGYGYARPSGPQSGIATLANIMGFAVVDVNMRGTGCSGGAFDFFEPLQGLDGYDVIETVARQPWVAHGKVGMLGISYGGISQLFTARTQPPSLAAITPISVIDQVQTTLYPGGILNTGFAFNWAKERAQEALPAGPEAGQPWAYERIQNGDEICKENQVLHAEAPDLLAKVRRNDTYRPKVADPLSPITFVDQINVPTFMACQNTDEQTGGHCPTLFSRFTGTDRKWFTMTNGTHIDALAPDTYNRLYDFLMLYVARQAPMTFSPILQASAPVVFEAVFGIDQLELPPDPIQQEPSYERALAAFEALPQVRVLMDNGAGGERPGEPYPGYELNYPGFPVPGVEGRSWHFARGGALADERWRRPAADRFRWDPGARRPSNFEGDTGSGENGLWTMTPPYKWEQPPAGTAASYVSEPLEEDVTAIGAGSVRAWVRSRARNVDLQATVTEIRPDGKEVFVQSGWLRATMRKLDKARSEPLRPVLSLRKRHLRPLPRKRFAKVTIPLYYQSHAYRKGSRIRVIISAPGADQPIWAFAEPRPKKGTPKVAIGYGGKRRSRLELPVVPGAPVPTGLPPCPGLRGEPCRAAP